MYFPKYWAKGSFEGRSADGSTIETACWGWSDSSAEEAAAKGRERAQSVVLRRPDSGDSHGAGYPYASAPLREEILRRLDGATDIVISRNAYGCEVMNAAEVVFVDVDLPEEIEKPREGVFSALFGKKKIAGPSRQDLETQKIEMLVRFQREHRETAFRVYRTAAGLRYLMTSGLSSPEDPLVQELFASVDCDKNFQQLCKIQKSFRARLTPKPWRCDADRPPYPFPYSDDKQRAAMKTWESRYNSKAKNFATCLFLSNIGGSGVDMRLEPIVKEHDALTNAESSSLTNLA